MNALKILNIALLALIITLVMNMFLPKQNQTALPNDVTVVPQTRSVTIPNIPVINIHNTLSGAFVYNTCSNIEITQNSRPVNLQSLGMNCHDVTVPANTTAKIDLSSLHELFANKASAGSYIIRLNTGEIVREVPFTVENPGFVRSTLSKLIYEPIYNLFVVIISYIPGHSLGWAIVIITIIIRLILLVPQHKMLESTRKMSELNPKIRALQKEYENDRATLGMKMMELYKKEGVNPMGSCLPLLVQMPILLSLYWVISGISDTSNIYHLYPFLQGFNPAHINTEFFGINLLQIGGVLAGGMAILLAATQWFQSYLSIKAQPQLPKDEPKKELKEGEMPTLDPRMMQKMMLYFFPFMIGISALFFPLGLGLYWWIGLLFMIVQQWYVNSRAEKKKKKGEIVKK